MNISRRELKKFQSWYSNQPEGKQLRNPFLRMDEKEKLIAELYARFQKENPRQNNEY